MINNETIYLLSSKNNRDRLLNAVDQIESLKFIKKDIDWEDYQYSQQNDKQILMSSHN
jgi:hypothetical protein